jgi:hypothetical protein
MGSKTLDSLETKILSDSPLLTKVVRQRLEFFAYSGQVMTETVIIEISIIYQPHKSAETRPSILSARELAEDQQKIVILVSSALESNFQQFDDSFVDLITRPNVCFVNIRNLDQLWDKYHELDLIRRHKK